MPSPKEHFYSSEDYWNLPDGERAELIDGKFYTIDLPSRIHQELIAQFIRIIGNYINNKNCSCEIYPTPFAVNLNANDSKWVEPDVSVICDKTKLSERGCEGAPDFIIEIVSPSSRKMDYSKKNTLYSEAGVREYWIVDPEKEHTTIYRYEEDAAPMIIPFEQDIQVGIYQNLRIITNTNPQRSNNQTNQMGRNPHKYIKQCPDSQKQPGRRRQQRLVQRHKFCHSSTGK